MVRTYDNDIQPGFTVEVASSQPEAEDDELVRLCNRDIRRAAEEGRLVLETPSGSVEQDDLHGLAIHLRYATETAYRHGSPQTITGPPLIGLEFGLHPEYEGVSSDLSSFDSEVVVYGRQHIWRLTDLWDAEMARSGMAVGEPVMQEHDHEWASVEEIDLRTST